MKTCLFLWATFLKNFDEEKKRKKEKKSRRRRRKDEEEVSGDVWRERQNENSFSFRGKEKKTERRLKVVYAEKEKKGKKVSGVCLLSLCEANFEAFRL